MPTAMASAWFSAASLSEGKVPMKDVRDVLGILMSSSQKMRRVVRFGNSPNHLVCQDQEGWGERDPQRLSGLEVKDQLVLRRLLHGEGARLGALQNLVDVSGGTPEQVRKARAIGHQGPGLDILPKAIHRRQPARGRQLDQTRALGHKQWIQEHEECVRRHT